MMMKTTTMATADVVAVVEWWLSRLWDQKKESGTDEINDVDVTCEYVVVAGGSMDEDEGDEGGEGGGGGGVCGGVEDELQKGEYDWM